MAPERYRKKPVVVEAEQFDLDAFVNEEHSDYLAMRVELCVRPDCVKSRAKNPRHYVVQTLEGPLDVSHGDWIITGVKGEFYPCKPDIFEQTYEPVLET